LYAERISESGKPVIFSYEAEFEIAGQWFDPKLMTNQSGTTTYSGNKEFLKEARPQVVFSPLVRHLADSLAGSETDKFKIFRALYYWIDKEIPWASSLEYSIIDCIPDYTITYRHGDCGMVTFLLMSMARYKGIPARWQSGWMLHPGNKNLHDWCELWFEGAGWIPVDISFGLQKTDDPELRVFYLTGIDSYRMIINDDFGKELDPPKNFYRSEPFDFQRGEVEWKGGNLYFNQWDYEFKVLSLEKII
jgi:transglutaminase-like putative cysteine protease